MHTLDMRVCSVSLGDGVRLSEGGARFSFTETPAGFVPALYTPLLERAYALMHGEWGGEYSFTIAKRIPHLAGLGGSSAPVAGMARLWAKARGVTPDPRFLLRLGSDVPYMFRGGDARVRGTGEEVEGPLRRDVRGGALRTRRRRALFQRFVPRGGEAESPRGGCRARPACAGREGRRHDGQRERGLRLFPGGRTFGTATRTFAPGVRLHNDAHRARKRALTLFSTGKSQKRPRMHKNARICG